MDKHRKLEEFKIEIQSNIENPFNSNLEEIQVQENLEMPVENNNEKKTCVQIKLNGM